MITWLAFWGIGSICWCLLVGSLDTNTRQPHVVLSTPDIDLKKLQSYSVMHAIQCTPCECPINSCKCVPDVHPWCVCECFIPNLCH